MSFYNSQIFPLNTRAFSLIEVTVALGVIISILVPMLGLMMIGFRVSQESHIETRCAVIAQRIIASAQMLPHQQLEELKYTMDLEGMSVPESEAVIIATLRVFPDEEVVDIPASARLTRVAVTFTGTALANQSRVFASLIADTGSTDVSN